VRIDAHQHFWRYDAKEYGWIDDSMAVLQRDFLPDEAKREMTRVGVDACIAVQARQTPEETRFLLALADGHPSIAGVVGWVDLQAEDVRRQLESVAGHPRLVGVRHIVQSESDDRFLLRPAFCRGIGLLEEFGLAYDILIYSRHLSVAAEFVSRFPRQRFVLDHAAKPSIGSGEIDEWAQGIRRLAGFANVWCKLSGLVTEADWQRWTAGQIRPYIDVVFDCFGPNRIMIGSDWPVCTVAGSYARTMTLALDYVSGSNLTDAERDGVLGGNAQRFWRLDETRSAGSRADSSVRSRM
jgi:L-fuconolactonase